MNTRDRLLWAGILTGPIVWLIHFEAKFALAPLACTAGQKPALVLISLVTLAIAAGAGFVSWAQLRRLSREALADSNATVERARIMALAGVVLSAGFVLVIAAQAIPELMLAPCD